MAIGEPKWYYDQMWMENASLTITRKDLYMIKIMKWTNPNTPGLYEPENIRSINKAARRALGKPILSEKAYYHHSKPEDPQAAQDEPGDQGGYNLSPELRQRIETTLSILSSDLSHDRVCEAKVLLKVILEE